MVCSKDSVWHVWILLIVIAGLTAGGCATSGGLGSLPPIFPVEEIPPDLGDVVVDREVKPATIEITKDNITVEAKYYRAYDLDRKFNRGSMTSPFFYREAWHQGEKTDVFYVKITNNRQQPILFDVSKCVLKDDTGADYQALSYKENTERLLYKAGRDIKINNGLEKAKEILLEMMAPDGEIAPGQTIEGYLPFQMITTRATKVDLVIDLEKAPDTPIGRYRLEQFVFPFAHDKAIRYAQPATVQF